MAVHLPVLQVTLCGIARHYDSKVKNIVICSIHMQFRPWQAWASAIQVGRGFPSIPGIAHQ